LSLSGSVRRVLRKGKGDIHPTKGPVELFFKNQNPENRFNIMGGTAVMKGGER